MGVPPFHTSFQTLHTRKLNRPWLLWTQPYSCIAKRKQYISPVVSTPVSRSSLTLCLEQGKLGSMLLHPVNPFHLSITSTRLRTQFGLALRPRGPPSQGQVFWGLDAKLSSVVCPTSQIHLSLISLPGRIPRQPSYPDQINH